MAFMGPSLMNAEPPQMPGHSPQVASRMLDRSLELLTDPDLFKSADYGLSDHVNHTALPWPGRNGAPSLRIFPHGIVPLSVPYQMQTAHLNREVIVDPELLESVKLEGGSSCLSGGPEYDTSPEFRSSTRGSTGMSITVDEHVKPIDAALRPVRKRFIRKAISKFTSEHTMATSLL
ncbi:MAG: hypothetical protein Q9176_003160 [Flavoplaca citrina]